MIRTQVYFDEDDYQLIGALASKHGLRKAAMVRRVVSEGLRVIFRSKAGKKKGVVESLTAISKIGGKGPKDLGENLVEYLYGKKSQYAEK
jgi:hypothetical protein